MANLSSIDKLKLEKLCAMEGGYVLDFTNTAFQRFVSDTVRKDIYANQYALNGESKANRLRTFWSIEADCIVGRLLLELCEYWKTKNLINGVEIKQNDQNLYIECQNISNRLMGKKQVVCPANPDSENEFINREFKNISLETLNLDSAVTRVLNQRIDEIRKCLHSKASLAVIFICGSSLEGILLGVASRMPKEFNESRVSPKNKEGKVLQFHEWTLSNFIDVAHSLSLIGEDIKKFSHALRDFRNYIHPYQQMTSGFTPDEHTAKICWQVLQAAIFQLSQEKQS